MSQHTDLPTDENGNLLIPDDVYDAVIAPMESIPGEWRLEQCSESTRAIVLQMLRFEMVRRGYLLE